MDFFAEDNDCNASPELCLRHEISLKRCCCCGCGVACASLTVVMHEFEEESKLEKMED